MRAGGLILAGAATGLANPALPESSVVEIRMRSVDGGAHVMFDPVGLFVMPGTTVRWIIDSDVHTTTAYHPANESHPLRIPVAAESWDSGYLVDPGASFDVRLTVAGVYDYYCAPHELAGMVGRIVVGHSGGPGAMPFDYFKNEPSKSHWRSVPDAARAVFPPVAEIMARKMVYPS